jgi:hypothetical protein
MQTEDTSPARKIPVEVEDWFSSLTPIELRKDLLKKVRSVIRLRDNQATAEKALFMIQWFIASKYAEVAITDDFTESGDTLWHLTDRERSGSGYVRSARKDTLFRNICEHLSSLNKAGDRILYSEIRDMLQINYGIECQSVGSFFKAQLADAVLGGGNRNRHVAWGETKLKW